MVRRKKIKKVFFASNNGLQLQRLKRLLPFCQTVLYYEPSDKRDLTTRGWARAVLYAVSFILSLPIKQFFPRYFLGKVLTFSADGVSLYHRFVSRKMVESFRKEGVKVFVWGVEKENQIKKFLSFGVEGIITKRPDRARRVLSAIFNI